jgi:Zn-dependent M28 family amino/carboxypeptidase
MTFSGEEEGLYGSKALFEKGLVPRERIRFMVNLDMIGRNAEQPVKVFGQGIDERLRSQLEASAEALDLQWTFAGSGPRPANSDYGPFMEAGIPFLSYFTGEHADYHETSDHADKLEYRRMEQLLRWLAETLQAVASQP